MFLGELVNSAVPVHGRVVIEALFESWKYQN